MANLKTLRTRIKSIQSTKKITAAMKMIAAANLKKSQQRLVATRPYAGYMRHMMDNLTHNAIQGANDELNLMYGRQQIETVLIIVATSNRGLCGGFNAALIRHTILTLKKLHADNKQVKLLCLGRRGVDQLSRHYRDCFIDDLINVSTVSHATAKDLGTKLVTLFDEAVFDQCLFIYNQFISPLKQEITCQQLIPATTPQDLNRENGQVLNETGASIPRSGLNANGDQRRYHNDQNADDHDPIRGYDSANDRNLASDHDSIKQVVYEFEPSQQDILKILLPKNLTTQIYTAMLESDASEQGARMAAMESATRNAHDMITALSLKYNRTRQTYITNELIEIISGANAL